MRKLIILAVFLILVSCSNKVNPELKLGTYRAVLQVQDNKELPFIFEVTSKNTLKIVNAEEVVDIDEIEYRNDSIYIKMAVYEGYIAAKFDGDNFHGSYIKESLDRIVPFSAEFNNGLRFKTIEMPTKNITGNWETVFSENIEDDEYIAKGIFKQEGEKVTGTYRTQTGDYRYLEGVMDGNQLKLSTFDGAHAFLFTATVTDSTMEGHFYSGNHWKT